MVWTQWICSTCIYQQLGIHLSSWPVHTKPGMMLGLGPAGGLCQTNELMPWRCDLFSFFLPMPQLTSLLCSFCDTERFHSLWLLESFLQCSHFWEHTLSQCSQHGTLCTVWSCSWACEQVREGCWDTGKAWRVLVFGDRPGRPSCGEASEHLEFTMNLGTLGHGCSIHLCVGMGKEQTAATTHLYDPLIRSQHGRGRSDHTSL